MKGCFTLKVVFCNTPTWNSRIVECIAKLSTNQMHLKKDRFHVKASLKYSLCISMGIINFNAVRSRATLQIQIHGGL